MLPGGGSELWLPLTSPHLWTVLWTTCSRATILAFISRNQGPRRRFSTFLRPFSGRTGHSDRFTNRARRLGPCRLNHPRSTRGAHLPVVVRSDQAGYPHQLVPRAARPEQVRQGVDRAKVPATYQHCRCRGSRPARPGPHSGRQRHCAAANERPQPLPTKSGAFFRKSSLLLRKLCHRWIQPLFTCGRSRRG